MKSLAITGGVGTSIYMAPEVIISDKAAMTDFPFACDIFSYGVLAYQVLAGHRPYDNHPTCVDKSIHQIKQLVVQGLRPVLPLDGSWPAGVAELVQRCWSEEPRDRPTFSDIMLALENMKAAFDALDGDGAGDAGSDDDAAGSGCADGAGAGAGR